MKNRKGQMLIGVLVLLALLLIVVPIMVKYVQHEAKWSVKQGQNTNAFQLAEAGVDRGYQKIAESTFTWRAIHNGTAQAGFNFDVAYNDISGGTYSVQITSGPRRDDVTITSIGRDKMNRETRALKVVYTNEGINSAMYANGISGSGGVTIEWGPMKSRGNIILNGASNVCYPRKYAIGSIITTGISPQNCHNNWTSPASPCTNNVEYWAFNCAPGVPPQPRINLDDYKATAQATKCPVGNYPAGASPAGSCYWPGNVNFNNVEATSTGTVYVNGNLSVSNGFLWGDVIVTGDVSFSGGGRGVYSIPTAGAPDPFTKGIPAQAWKEYQAFDTAASAEYYGDSGYQTLSATFGFGLTGSPAKNIGTTAAPSVRGFLYCGGTISGGGGTAFHGVVFSPIGISGLSGGVAIYYDSDVATAIQTSTLYLSRTSWLDSKQPWPAALP